VTEGEGGPLPRLFESLERLRRLEEDAYHQFDPGWRIDLKPPADKKLLNNFEHELDRHFSADVRELYGWHGGCGGETEFVPDIDFNSMEMAREIHDGLERSGALDVTNDTDAIWLSDLFPVFNHETILFCTRIDSQVRRNTSPLYLLDLEFGQLTKQAHTVRDFIDHLIELFERGQFEVSGRFLRWTAAPYRFESDIEPYGLPT
jgi:hypothetical protein